MVAYLSPGWLDLQRDLFAGLPKRPGVSARVQHVVTGGPDGEVRYHQSIVDGQLQEIGPGDDPDAELTLTQTYVDSVEVATGAVAASAAFMQGRVKVTGSMGTVMALMPLTQSEEHLAALVQLSAQTEY